MKKASLIYSSKLLHRAMQSTRKRQEKEADTNLIFRRLSEASWLYSQRIFKEN